jgi:hypothetical protein
VKKQLFQLQKDVIGSALSKEGPPFLPCGRRTARKFSPFDCTLALESMKGRCVLLIPVTLISYAIHKIFFQYSVTMLKATIAFRVESSGL